MAKFESKVIKNLRKLSRANLENLLKEHYNQKSVYIGLLNSVSQALFLIDTSNDLIRLNAAAKRYVLKLKRYEGKKVVDVIANKDVKKQFESILLYSANAPDEVGYIEFSIFEKREIIFGLVSFPCYEFDMVDDDGFYYSSTKEVVGSILVLTDITGLKKMYSKQSVESSMASLSMLMAGIAHEIKNPLGALDLHLQLLMRLVNKENFPKKKEFSDLLEIIKVEIKRLDGIANDFLTHFRLERSVKKNKSLNDILDKSLEVIMPRIKDRKINLIVKKQENMKSFFFDQNQIHQLLLNLLENAINAIANSDNEGTITIFTKNFSDKVILSIKDSGCGMTEIEKNKIFNPFYTNNTTGTGLGLPIVKKIVTHHNGKITVDTKKDEGSTFTISFYRTPNQGSSLLQLEKK